MAVAMWSSPPYASICDSMAALEDAVGVAACAALLAGAAAAPAPFFPWATARSAALASTTAVRNKLQRIFMLFLQILHFGQGPPKTRTPRVLPIDRIDAAIANSRDSVRFPVASATRNVNSVVRHHWQGDSQAS